MGSRGGRRGADAWEGGDERGKIRAIGRCKRVFFQMRAGDSEKNREKREQNPCLTSKNALYDSKRNEIDNFLNECIIYTSFAPFRPNSTGQVCVV